MTTKPPKPTFGEAVVEAGTFAFKIVGLVGVVLMCSGVVRQLAMHAEWFVILTFVAVAWFDYRGERDLARGARASDDAT